MIGKVVISIPLAAGFVFAALMATAKVAGDRYLRQQKQEQVTGDGDA